MDVELIQSEIFIINQDSLEQQFKERVDVEIGMQDINKLIDVAEYQILIPKAEL